jgi:hypothetical protein
MIETGRDYPFEYPELFDCDCDPDFSYKVGKLKGIPVFNLRAIETCPYRTFLCEASCYARGSFFNHPRSRRLYQRNLIASRCGCFKDRMIYVILNLMNYVMLTRHKTIRLHSSGDFYSRSYFQKWVNIANTFPDISFFAYTRNYTIDFNLCPDNLIMYYSRDVTTKKINLTAKRYSYMLPEHKDTVKVKHLTKYKQGVVCKSERCDLCKHCWTEKGDVYFPQKYKRHEILNNKQLLELKILVETTGR